MLRLCKIHANRSVSVWNGLLAMSAGWGAITEFIWVGGVTMAVLFLHESWFGAAFGGGCDLCPAVLTVPLTFFCKRHGRLCHLPHDFDRAFDAFL